MVNFGNAFVAAALLLCWFVVCLAISKKAFADDVVIKFPRIMQKAMVLAAAALWGAIAILVVAFLSDDFAIEIVAKYGGENLSIPYKIAALWASTEGSFLLWTALIAACFVVMTRTSETLAGNTVMLAMSAFVLFGFCWFLVFAAKPFELLAESAITGHGLNYLLRNFWMVVHPPLLFIGYAATAVIFAISCCSTFKHSVNGNEIHNHLKRWASFAMLFLTAGIASGARWAYLELGWGGYWAWDPVESASLLPWLFCLAVLHCLKIKNKKSKQKWLAWIGPLPFVMTLVATFLTRSGVVASVHAFAAKDICWILPVFIAACVALWLRAIAGVVRKCVSQPTVKNHIDKLLFGFNILCCFTAVVILVAIIMPILSKAFSSNSIVMARGFYDRIAAVVAAIAIMLLLIWLLIKKIRRAKIFTISPANISHIGFLMLAIAVWASGQKVVKTLDLEINKPITIADCEFVYDSFKCVNGNEFVAAGPVIHVTRNNKTRNLWPRDNVYDQGKKTSEVAVANYFAGDVYLSFDSAIGRDHVAVTVRLIPAMMWLWVSCLLIIVGFGANCFWHLKKKVKA